MSEDGNPGLTFSLDQILDVAARSVRRAYAFLGLGVYASELPSIEGLDLSHETNIRMLPEVLSDTQIEEIKREFKIWVISGGFRELNESFSVFLDHAYGACALIAASEHGKISSGASIGVPKSYSHASMGDKIRLLRSKFGLTIDHEEELISLSRARRCLAHRRGVVGIEDADRAGKLIVKWIATDQLLQLNDGREILIPPVVAEPIDAKPGGTIVMKMVSREVGFDLDQLVNFTTHELAEICWFYLREAVAIRDALVLFAKERDVPIVEIAVPAARTEDGGNQEEQCPESPR